MDPTAILIISSAIIMFLVLLGISYKTGFVSYSIWSLTRQNQPKFEIDKNKTNKFIGVVTVVFLLNIVYGLVVLRDVRQIAGILILGLFNTVVIAYGSSFWILLKEKKPPKS